MATTGALEFSTYPMEWTAADWQADLGGIPWNRIRMYPRPGMATEQDVLEVHARTGRLCELIDGVLVEKPMGFHESEVATEIICSLRNYLRIHRVGTLGGEGGTLRILPGQVRIPDVSFVSWDRMPAQSGPIPAVTPDLAVEVLSESNTEREMSRKLREYFAGGARLVWYIDPPTRTARAYTSPEQYVFVDEEGSLTGGDVLPGFELRLKDLFAVLERPTAPGE